MIGRTLGGLARTCFRHPSATFAAALLLSLGAGLATTTLTVEQNLLHLLPPDLPALRTFHDLRKNFDVEQNLFVLLEGDNLIEESDRYVDRLRARPELVASADNRLSAQHQHFLRNVLPRHLFLTLSEKDLKETLTFLNDPDALLFHMNNNLRLLRSPAPGIKEQLARDPLRLADRTGALRRMLRGGLRIALTEEGYFLSEDGTALLILIKGANQPQDITFSRELVSFARDCAPESLTARQAGGYAIAVQNEEMIRGDMTRSSIFSITAIFLLFWILFRSKTTLLRLGIPLLLALLWTLGIVSLFFGPLNPLIGGATAIIAGLGIDFSIHVLARFRHERSRGMSPEEAIGAAVEHVGGGLVIAGLTTVAVFFSFQVSQLPAMAIFGLVTGIGILLCLFTTITILPALLSLGTTRTAPLLPSLSVPEKHSRPLLAISTILFSGSLFYALLSDDVFTFEPDWKNLGPRNDPVLAAQQDIGTRFLGSTETMAILLREKPIENFWTLQPVLADLYRKKVLAGYQTLSTFLPPSEHQVNNQKILKTIDARRIRNNVEWAMDRAGFRKSSYNEYLDGLVSALQQEHLLEKDDLAILLKPYLSGDLGTAQLYPAEEMWDRATREKVVHSIRTSLEGAGVSCELTGFKLVSAELESLLRRDFAMLLLVAAGVVVLITLTTFRDPMLTLLALFPLICGLTLLAAFMKLCGLNVNVMNLIAFPMVMGLGIDDGVHLVHLYRKTSQEEFPTLLPVTLRAVFLTTLTTVLGFGALALTENQGVASLGWVCGAGMICCLIPSFFTLPAVLLWMNRRRSADV